MSLDIAVLDKNGIPLRQVCLDNQVHAEMMNCAKNCCELLLRLFDYYRDVEFSIDELPLLLTELNTIMSKIEVGSQLASSVRELILLVQVAIDKQVGLVALAD